MTEEIPPKLFISYSWTNQKHIDFVTNLATELRSDNAIDVIFDKWDLKEGNDAFKFMEGNISDPNVKVLMVVDKTYAEKSDSKKGGAGIEAQIIAPDVYKKHDQNKFVALALEEDESGEAYLPIYCKSRLYIDLRDDTKYNEKLEEIARWVHDKPLYEKPPIGKKPAFLSEENSITIPTTTLHRRMIEAIKNRKPNMTGCINEYLDAVFIGLEEFRIKNDKIEFDDVVIDSIKKFLPYRNEYISFIDMFCQYTENSIDIKFLHKFFEKIIPYLYRPAHITSWNGMDFDNFKFIIHELFLYTISIFIKNERFENVDYFLSNEYYYNRSDSEKSMLRYNCFRNYIDSLDEHRNNRLNLKRVSIHADLLKERAEHSIISFECLMQADFVLHLKGMIETDDFYDQWYPTTLIYASNRQKPFEIFVRSVSKRYFSKMNIILGGKNKEELSLAIQNKQLRRDYFRSSNFYSTYEAFLGIEDLCTKP